MSELLVTFKDNESLKLLQNVSDDPNDLSISTRYYTLYTLLPDLRGKVVLDLPCGMGKQARSFVLESGAKKVIAVDILERQIEIAKEDDSAGGILPGQIEYRCHDARIPQLLTNDLCDICTSIHLFCFAEDYSQLVNMCRCVYSNLAPGGVSYLVKCSLSQDDRLVKQFGSLDGVRVIHIDPWHGEVNKPRRCHYMWQGLEIHVCVWEYEAVCSAMKEAGFTSIELHPYKKNPLYSGMADIDLYLKIVEGNVIIAKK